MRDSWLRKCRWALSYWLVVSILALVACGAAATPTLTPVTAPATAKAPAAADAPRAAAGPTATAAPTRTPAVAKLSVGRLKIAVTPPPHETNHPFRTAITGQWQLTPMLEALLRVAPTGEVVPMLATDYAMSPDAKSLTINLRKGVRWHGNWGEFSANDLVHSLQAIADKESLTGQAGIWRTLLELPNNTDRIVVVSDYQVKLHLAKPELSPNTLLTTLGLYLLSKAQFDAEGPAGLTKKPAGTGPYEFVERKLGESLLYKRAEGKHWRVTPDFDELQLLLVPEETTRLAMMLAGEAHIAELSADAVRAATLRGMKEVFTALPGKRLVLVFGGNYLPTTPQYKSDVPWTKKSVREAMNRAVNRSELRDTLFGGGSDISILDPIHSSHPGWNPRWAEQFEQNYGYDPARAKALLKEAGYPQGFKVNLDVSPRPGVPQIVTLAEAIGNYWRAIGLDVNITQYEYATIRDRSRKLNQYNPWFNAGTYQLTPVPAIFTEYYSKTDVHHYFNDLYIDQRYEEILATSDLSLRDRELRQFGDFLFSEYANLPLFWIKTSSVIDPRVVADYTSSGVPTPLIGLEYIKAVQ